MASIKITILSKPDCCLCEDAKAVIAEVSQNYPVEVNMIDIEGDRDLYERYWDKIPVVFVNDKKVFIYKVDKKVLQAHLKRAMQKKH